MPGTLMGLACCILIGSFCTVHGFFECQLGCGIGIVSCLACLFTMSYFRNEWTTPLATIAALSVLSYCIFNVFSPEVTDMLVLVINTLSCVLYPFDTADKLLTTKDTGFLHIQMHSLATFSSLIWGLDYLFRGATVMVLANFSGVACELIVFISYLYAIGTLHESSPLVSFARSWQYVLYHIPSKMLSGGSGAPIEKPKRDEKIKDIKKKQ